MLPTCSLYKDILNFIYFLKKNKKKKNNSGSQYETLELHFALINTSVFTTFVQLQTIPTWKVSWMESW